MITQSQLAEVLDHVMCHGSQDDEPLGASLRARVFPVSIFRSATMTICRRACRVRPKMHCVGFITFIPAGIA